MKWVYVGIVDGKLSAFHKKKKVMLNYLKNYQYTNPLENVSMGKILKSKVKDTEEYAMYYLEDWGCGYIQSKFVHIMQINSDEEYSMQMEINNLLEKQASQRDEKKLIKILEEMKFLKKDDYVYTPSLKELYEQFWLYEEYKNQIY